MVTEINLISFILSAMIGLVLTPLLAYVRYIANKSSDKCRAEVSKYSSRYSELFNKLVDLGLCISRSKRYMSRIIREGAVHLNILNESANFECPDLVSRVYKLAPVYGLVSLFFGVLFAYEAGTDVGIYLFLLYYTTLLYNMAKDIKQNADEISEIMERAKLSEEELLKIIEELERVCSRDRKSST